ncbi:MAG: HPr family phosphocarrier protein [Planctomycetia bacterium]|nr:HPr family phosphocarrier protein [Planctomycetia bacterium]
MSEPRARPIPSPAAGAPAPGAKLSAEGSGAAALDRVLSEAAYRARFATEIAPLLRLERLLDAGFGAEGSRAFCVRVVAEAERVEYGLLEVGARDSRTFAYVTEVVTQLRWCAKALHALLHLRGRIRRYLGERTDLDAFRADLDACIAWVAGRVEALLVALRTEVQGPLGLAVPEDAADVAALDGEDVRWRLPQDLDVPSSHDDRDRVADMCAAFLALGDEVERVVVPEGDLAALDALARGPFGPASAQELRVRMHAVQSSYDSTIAGTPHEAEDPRLPTFRGYVSILLHLLEAVAYLLSAHGRLASDVRSAALRDRVRRLVDEGLLLRWSLRFGLVNAARCFREARTVAQALLARATRVREVALALPPGRKLHLRPAGLIVRVVQRHGLPVEMGMGEQTVDARQLMDVILLAAGNPSETRVRFRGDERPLADLQALFEHRLGEEGTDRFPLSLAYLREPAKPS